MENASKALIIAGGVLVAILIISILVNARGTISEWMNSNQKVKELEQVDEFNKQYDAYYRNNIYGSELLSLVNKVLDFREKYRKDEDGYTPLEMYVKFNNDLIIFADSKKQIFLAGHGEYKSAEISNKIQNDIEKNGIEAFGNLTYGSKATKVKDLAGLRTNEIEQIVPTGSLASAQANINKYSSYKNALSQFNSKKFSATNFKYNKDNGMIEEMHFKEI